MRIGELFILGFKGPVLPPWVKTFERQFGLGGVILFDYDAGKRRYENNIESPRQLSFLSASLKVLPSQPLIFIDQEGGWVRRLKEKRGFAPLPSAKAFAKLSRDERLRVARASFSEMRRLGLDFDLTPVIDLDLNPENPDIGKIERAFSKDAKVVKENAELLAQVAREVGLQLCLKHYPGLGGAKVNSHLELTDISSSIDEIQLKLFDDLTPQIPGQAVLLSHGMVNQWEPQMPVSMSAPGVGRLRDRFPGALLLSDDLQMEGLQRKFSTANAILKGIAAGLDMLIVGNNLKDESAQAESFALRLQKALDDNPWLQSRAKDALFRVSQRKKRLV